MPYNTRRKSLSLPSLGIAVPGSARSTPSTTTTTTTTTTTLPMHPQQPPSKRVKRSHSTTTPLSPPRPTDLQLHERPKSSGRTAFTPPPSPGGASGQTKVDTQGIDDTIVVGVIEQLEKTGNRPHLLKELAAVLSSSIPIVESSANPAAIISSRLATYLKRTWTALSRCPLEKKLVGTHPKRVFYFLTTCPAQPIPADAGNSPAAPRIISPSLSSATSEEEDLEARSRDRMSPSPELDLSSPDFDDGTHPFSNQTHPPTSANISHNRRAQSPPLERDEKEFTQTASFLQQRRKSQQAERERSNSAPTETAQHPDVTMDDIPEVDETEESAARKNSETAAALFGHFDHVSVFATSSPMLKPALHHDMPPPSSKASGLNMETDDIEWSWSEMKSPENVNLDELDDLFGGY